MYTLNMLKRNVFKAAMGVDPWDVHTLPGFTSAEMAMITARDLARSALCYEWAEIGDGNGYLALGQVFEGGSLMWAAR